MRELSKPLIGCCPSDVTIAKEMAEFDDRFGRLDDDLTTAGQKIDDMSTAVADYHQAVNPITDALSEAKEQMVHEPDWRNVDDVQKRVDQLGVSHHSHHVCQ